MQSDDKIHGTYVFMMILQIIGLGLVVTLLSNNTFAQTLHDRTLYEVVKQTPELEKNSQIDVGKAPTSIDFNYLPFLNTIYVANSLSNSVSVIIGSDNTKIGEDIPVGERP